MQRQSGFTLFELIITLAIFAILASAAIPGLFKWLPKHRVGVGARNVKAAVEFARTNAIKANSVVTLNLDFASDSLTVVDSGGITLRTRSLHADVDLEDIDLGTTVTFTGQGFSTSAGQVTVINTKDATVSRTLNLTLGGNARIQ